MNADERHIYNAIREHMVYLGFPQARTWTDLEIEQGCTAFQKLMIQTGITVSEFERRLRAIADLEVHR